MSKYLLRDEKIVYNVIQEYLGKNRTFHSSDLIEYINSRFSKTPININKEGIKTIINSLLKKNLVVEKSKFTKDEVLSNSNRKIIYDCIKNNPGIHFNKLFKELNLSVAVVEWHLNILCKFNFIRKQKIENFDAYFVFDIDSKVGRILHITSREKCRKIIEYIKTHNEGTTKYHLSRELEMHPTTITKYLKLLDEYGLLIKKNQLNKVLYFLNEEDFRNLKNYYK